MVFNQINKETCDTCLTKRHESRVLITQYINGKLLLQTEWEKNHIEALRQKKFGQLKDYNDLSDEEKKRMKRNFIFVCGLVLILACLHSIDLMLRRL